MSDWEYELVGEMKKIGKPQTAQGPCIGKTLRIDPFLVSIQDGKIMIDSENGHVCRQLRERKSKFKATGTMEQSGTLNASCSNGSHSSYSASGQVIQEGDMELNTVWKAGDEVLVVPDGAGQHFFIVDVLEVV